MPIYPPLQYSISPVLSGASTHFKIHAHRPNISDVNNDPGTWEDARFTDIVIEAEQECPRQVSIGILAWNEEKSIGAALESLFRQTLFGKLAQRKLRCEIVLVGNGCTDGTGTIATKIFTEKLRWHPCRDFFTCRFVDLQERGKINAWNRYVHEVSSPDARYLFLMDADIVINEAEALWNMVAALESNPQAMIATDTPRKHIAARKRKSAAERLSLRAAQMTRAGEAQLCAQLYCIRAETARRIHLPKDLPACEDGFIKSVVCTDFLTRETNPRRIIAVPGASHTFEAYTSLCGILKNQKRQMIGQAAVHVLVDNYLPTLSASERRNLAVSLFEKDRKDPTWLKILIAEHVRRTRVFWRLVPGLAGFRFQRLARLKGLGKITCLPAALAGFAVSMVSCFMAYGFLKQGNVAYWPHAKSPGHE